jgi:hypothetical protein
MTFLPAEEENHLRNEQIYIFFFVLLFCDGQKCDSKVRRNFLDVVEGEEVH